MTAAQGDSLVPRIAVSEEIVDLVIEYVKVKLESRLEQHGRGAYAGPHETYGILAEEYDELLDAMRHNNSLGFGDELIDIAVGAIFGKASQLTLLGEP